MASSGSLGQGRSAPGHFAREHGNDVKGIATWITEYDSAWTDFVQVGRRPGVASLYTQEFYEAASTLIRDIDDNAKARVIVISSTGKHFSAGMDVSVFSDGEGIMGAEMDRYARAEAFRQFVLHLQESFSCLERAAAELADLALSFCFWSRCFDLGDLSPMRTSIRWCPRSAAPAA